MVAKRHRQMVGARCGSVDGAGGVGSGRETISARDNGTAADDADPSRDDSARACERVTFVAGRSSGQAHRRAASTVD